MAWIESHQSLMSHHKTRKAARLLGVKPVHLIGHLHALWWWALDYADDGDVTRFDAEDIADAGQWDDDAAAFVEALTVCGPGDAPGFLERTDDGRLLIHDWWDYAGKLVERRRADAERKRSSRHPEPVQRTSSGHPADGAKSPSVTLTVTNSNRNQPTNQTENSRSPVAAAPRKPAPVPKPTEIDRQNPIWDALVQETGKPATKNERSDFGETVSQLKDANTTVEEIHAFPHWWYESFPGATLTHRCYRDHLGKFRSAPPRPMLPSDIKDPGIRALIETRPEEYDAIRDEVRAKNGRPVGFPPQARRLGDGGHAAQQDVLPPAVRTQRG